MECEKALCLSQNAFVVTSADLHIYFFIDLSLRSLYGSYKLLEITPLFDIGLNIIGM